MLDAYDREVAFTPDIVSTASSPTVSVALSPSDHLTIGGERLKRNMYGLCGQQLPAVQTKMQTACLQQKQLQQQPRAATGNLRQARA